MKQIRASSLARAAIPALNQLGDSLPQSVVARWMTLADVQTSDFEIEELNLQNNFSEERRREFAAGRCCAREALHALGYTATPIHTLDDGSPRWPPEVTGSISHCNDMAIAMLANKSEIAALGIDVEQYGRVSRCFRKQILSDAEKSKSLSEEDERLAERFTAKECVIKAWSVAKSEKIHFRSITISLEPQSCRFTTSVETKHGQILEFQNGLIHLDENRVYGAFWIAA